MMKTPLIYGLLLAIVGALLTFGLFFAGFHDSMDKLKAAQWIGGLIGLVAAAVCYVLAMRDARRNAPTDRPWGYGSALGCGVLTALWGSLFSAIVSYFYMAFVNPQLSELIYQAQVAQAQQRGMNATQLEAASRFMHIFTSPAVLTASNAIGGFVIAVLMCLIIAIFFRQARTATEPVEAPSAA